MDTSWAQFVHAQYCTIFWSNQKWSVTVIYSLRRTLVVAAVYVDVMCGGYAQIWMCVRLENETGSRYVAAKASLHARPARWLCSTFGWMSVFPVVCAPSVGCRIDILFSVYAGDTHKCVYSPCHLHQHCRAHFAREIVYIELVGGLGETGRGSAGSRILVNAFGHQCINSVIINNVCI